MIGAGQWFRYLVGTLELAGGIGLLTPWLAGVPAAGLAADMAGATIVNATVLHDTTYGANVWITALLCAVFVLLAYGRRRQIKGLASAIRRVNIAGPGAKIQTRTAWVTAESLSFAEVLDLFFLLLALSANVSVFGMINTLSLRGSKAPASSGCSARSDEPVADAADDPLREHRHRAHRRRARAAGTPVRVNDLFDGLSS